MSVFGVGAFEALLVLVVALILVGPERFPEVARQGGRWYRMARRYTAEVMKDVRSAVDELESEVQTEADEFRQIRELGDDLSRDMRTTSKELDEVGREASAAAAEREGPGEPKPGLGPTQEPASARGTAAEQRPGGAKRVPAQKPARTEPSSAEPSTTEPTSIRPSKRPSGRRSGGTRNGT